MAQTGSRVHVWLQATELHPQINKVVVYFLGFPGANGVYCLAKGFQHKYQETGILGQVVTAEIDDKRRNRFLRFLEKENLAQFV